MEKRLRITVIVPVHNTGAYISDCINSILNQTYKPIEIICVDSSTDETTSLIRNMTKDNLIIKHIVDSNSSYGYKLNIGIKEAKGELLSIVDSDDYIGNEMFDKNELLMRKNKLDLCKNDYYDFASIDGNNIDIQYQNICALACYYNHVTNIEKEPCIIRDTGLSIWTGLYSTKFLKENCIFLNESEGASYQDTSFGLMTLFKAKRIMFNHDAYYRYRIDNANSSVKNDTKYKKIIEEFMYFEKKVPLDSMTDNVRMLYLEKKLKIYLWNCTRLSSVYRKLFLDNIRQEIKYMLNSGIYNDFSHGGCLSLLRLITEMI